MLWYQRNYNELQTPESNTVGYESITILALSVMLGIGVVSWVSAKIHEQLNALDTATAVVARKTDYKKPTSPNPMPKRSNPSH